MTNNRLHKAWFSTALVLLASLAQCQNVDTAASEEPSDSTAKPQYRFVNYDLNHFTGVENSVSFRNYYQQFDQMMRSGSGELSIIHFGGSHLQADIWSNLLRERLQSIDTNIRGGRGLLFPFRAAKTNRPYSYNVDWTGEWQGHRSSYNKHQGTWGVSGITASSVDDSLSLHFTFYKPEYRVKTKRLRLLSNVESTAYEVEVVIDSGLTVETIEDAQGYTVFEFSAEVDSFTIIFQKPDSLGDTLELYGLISDNDNPGIRYNSVGVNGSRFVSFERCELFQEQLTYLKPDLVIMSIGTNDSSEPDYDSATYKQDFREFLTMMRWANPECAIMLTVPNDNYVRRKYHNDNLSSVRNVIYELAEEFDAKVWDLYGIMGDSGSAKTWMHEGMMKSDLVHFTNEGYLVKGDLFYQAFLEDYLKWYNDQQPVWTE